MMRMTFRNSNASDRIGTSRYNTVYGTPERLDEAEQAPLQAFFISSVRMAINLDIQTF
jgi:hypothetical protein